MSAKDMKSEIFSCIKIVKGEFLTRTHTISLKKRGSRHIFSFVLMQICAGLKEHMREIIDYMCFALFA